MSKPTVGQENQESSEVLAAASPEAVEGAPAQAGTDGSLSDAELDPVSGGLNPQPLPPKEKFGVNHSFSTLNSLTSLKSVANFSNKLTNFSG